MKYYYDNTNYIQLIKKINYDELLTFSEYSKLKKINKKYLLIRHDVDINLDSIDKFIQVEYKNNIRSTYFLLHTADYFDYSQKLVDVCNRILDYGHEIGFHNDLLREYVVNGKRIRDQLEMVFGFFDRYNVPVRGTSAHGHRHCYQLNFLNYEMWKEHNPKIVQGLFNKKLDKQFCKRYKIDYQRYNKMMNLHLEQLEDSKKIKRLPKYKLSTFGLEYETYFIPKLRSYLTDPGLGPFTGCYYSSNRNYRLFDRFIKMSKNNIGFNTVKRFNQNGKGAFQLSIHCSEKWS